MGENEMIERNSHDLERRDENEEESTDYFETQEDEDETEEHYENKKEELCVKKEEIKNLHDKDVESKEQMISIHKIEKGCENKEEELLVNELEGENFHDKDNESKEQKTSMHETEGDKILNDKALKLDTEEKIRAPRVAKSCFLCGNAKKNNCELFEVVSSSGYTFSDVLAKLFSKEDLPPSLAEKDHSQGLLCSHCQSLVTDLFRLQKELKTVKNVIVRIYRNSETVCETATSDIEPCGHQKKEKKIKGNITKIDTLSDNVTFEKAAQKRVSEKKTHLIDNNKVDTQSSNQKRKRSQSNNFLDDLDNKAAANETSAVGRKKRKKSIKVDP